MEKLCRVIGIICLTPALAYTYQLQSDNSKTGYVSVRYSRSNEPHGDRGMLKHGYATNSNAEDFSNVRFKERKAIKRYSSPSFIPRERIDHKRIEVIPPTLYKKNVQNESSENRLIDKSKVLSNQRRGLHHSDILQAKPRDRIDYRRIEVVAPTIYKKNVQNQSSGNHSIDKSEVFSNQRRKLHNLDGLQALPIAKQPVRQFIVNHQDILRYKMYEKPSYLAVNVHKAQVTTAPLSLNVRSKFPTKIMSDQIQKLQAALVDKPMPEEKRAADSDRKPDGRDQSSINKDRSFREYAKRETQLELGFKDTPHHGLSDSLKRYITFKDKGIVEPKSPRVQGAIGIRTDNIEENIPIENPYAIFYKIHQNLDDGFIPAPIGKFGSVEENSDLFNNKKKQLSANYETKNPNRVMKKFFSFNNNKHY